MAKSRGMMLWVAFVGIATVVAHAWLDARHERQMAALLGSAADVAPMVVQAIEPPLSPRFLEEPSLLELVPVNYEADLSVSEPPADALQPSSRKTRPHAKIAAAGRPSRQQLEDEAAVREVIEEEMSETSAEERDIWFEELRSLPAEAVRDMLQVRKQLRLLTPDHHISGPATLPSVESESPDPDADIRIIPAEPTGQRSSLHSGDWRETRHVLQQAIDWSLHNAANATTPGYKRVRITLGDAYAIQDAHGGARGAALALETLRGTGCCLKSIQVDMQPGEIVETGRELDVAIQGNGYFVLRQVESTRAVYTRCGAWTLDAERRLSQTNSEENYLLNPILAIPEAATAVEISTQGMVAVRLAGQEALLPIGQISLAQFDAEQELVPVGNCLFTAPEGISPRRNQEGLVSAGALKQFALEQSNVNLMQEQQERTAWEAVLRALPSADVPRTAQQEHASPR